MAENIIPSFGAHVVPSPEHPLYDKLKSQSLYTTSILARHALLRHVRLKKEDLGYHLNLMSGLQLGSIGNEVEWGELFNTLNTDYKTLNMFINASNYWVGLSFKETSDYHTFTETFVTFCGMQFAESNLIPSSVKKDFDPVKSKDLLLVNPLVLFLLMVFLGGPLSREEVRGITLEVN